MAARGVMAVMGLAVLAGQAARAEVVLSTGGPGPKLSIYGQLDPAKLSFDDGQEQKSLIVDNANANSRVGFWLDWTDGTAEGARFNFETALGMLQSNAVSMAPTPEFLFWTQTSLRKFELTYAGDLGRIWGGQGSMATDGIAEIDLSKTAVAGYSDYQAVAGGFAFRGADGALSDVAIKDVFVNLEGSRLFRLRYDTPEMSGLTFSLAYGENILTEGDTDRYGDAALRYAGKAGRFSLQGGLGYAATRSETGETTGAVMGSASVLDAATGLSFTLAAGQQIDGGHYVYGKGGWAGRLIPAGQTAVAAEIYRSEDIGVEGSGQSWGVMATQRIDGAATELYLGWRDYRLAGTAVDYQAAQSVLMGARWTF